MTEREIIQTIKVPDGIKMELKDNHTVTFTSSNGSLTRSFKSHRLKVSIKGNNLILEGKPVNKQTRALLMTVIALTKGIIEGLLYGYKYSMKISYSHFPMTAKVEGKFVTIGNFIGEKFARKAAIVGDVKVDIKGQDVIISGRDKYSVGQTVGNIEQATKVKGKEVLING